MHVQTHAVFFFIVNDVVWRSPEQIFSNVFKLVQLTCITLNLHQWRKKYLSFRTFLLQQSTCSIGVLITCAFIPLPLKGTPELPIIAVTWYWVNRALSLKSRPTMVNTQQKLWRGNYQCYLCKTHDYSVLLCMQVTIYMQHPYVLHSHRPCIKRTNIQSSVMKLHNRIKYNLIPFKTLNYEWTTLTLLVCVRACVCVRVRACVCVRVWELVDVCGTLLLNDWLSSVLQLDRHG